MPEKNRIKKTKQSKQETAESKRSKVNKHGNIQQKSKTKNKSDAAAMLSQLLLKRSSAILSILTELKNKNKKRPKWDGKVESLKKEKKLQIWWQLPPTLCIHTIYYYYYKKIKYLHYIHSVSKYITTLRYASYYICCCNYLRVPYTVEKPNCRIISLYTFCPKKYFFFSYFFYPFLGGNK